MALTVANQLTTIIDCDSDTDWTGSDASIGLDTDIFYETSGSIAWDTDIETYYADYTWAGDQDFTTLNVWFWFMSMTPGYLDTWENGGIGLKLEDDLGNWSEWFCAGSDTYKGGWKRFVVYTGSTPDDQSATPPVMTKIRVLSIRVKALTKSKLTDNTYVDYIQTGSVTQGIKITGGTAGDKDFDEMVAKDETVYAGLVTKSNGVFYINGALNFGDDAAGDMNFLDTSQVVMTEDWFRNFTTVFRGTEESLVSANHYTISVVGSGGADIKFQIGSKSGTQGVSGCVFKSRESEYTAGRRLIFTAIDTDLDEMKLYGCTFLGAGAISLPVNAAGREVLNCNFEKCVEIDPDTCIVKYSNFIGSTSTTTGALMLDSTTMNVSVCNFIGCSRAIRFPTGSEGSYAFTSMMFTNNTVDIRNEVASGKTVTINCGGTPVSDPVTHEEINGGATTIINTATLKVTCKNDSGLAVEGVRVRIEKVSDGSLISEGVTNASGIYQDDTYNYGGDTPVYIIARLKGYKNNKASDTITTAGLSVPFTMLSDPAVDLP